MKKSKALTLFFSLISNKEEEKALIKAVSKKFPDNGKLIPRLFNFLLKEYQEHHPDNPNIDKHILFKRVFGAKIPYNDEKLRRLFSRFNRFLETFLAEQVINQESCFFYLELANTFERLHLPKSFYDAIEKVMTRSKKTP